MGRTAGLLAAPDHVAGARALEAPGGIERFGKPGRVGAHRLDQLLDLPG
jgi:hypothetical protein